MDNRAYLERAADYDIENQHKSRTMLKKAELVAAAIESHSQARSLSMLELGCGTGLFTKLLAERFPLARITATDAFLPMLDLAARRLSGLSNVRLAQYDAETAGLFDQPFDVVCGVDLIHHLNDPVAGLRQWRLITATGGALVFFESNPRNPLLYLRTRSRPEEARFKYNTRRNLKAWVTAAGWTSAVVDYAPIHLPSGPPACWRVFGQIERLLHPVFRPIAGGMLVYGEAAADR